MTSVPQLCGVHLSHRICGNPHVFFNKLIVRKLVYLVGVCCLQECLLVTCIFLHYKLDLLIPMLFPKGRLACMYACMCTCVYAHMYVINCVTFQPLCYVPLFLFYNQTYNLHMLHENGRLLYTGWCSYIAGMHDKQAILILFFSFFFNCMNKTKS